MERWSNSATISIKHEMVSGTEDLIDFPFYFVCQNRVFANAQPSGADFIFTLEDGKTKLCHEIRSWTPADCRLVAYIKVPRISPVHNTKIVLHWGNPHALDQQDVPGVWSKYAYVRHLSDKPDARNPPAAKGGTITRTAWYEMQRRVLEDLFGAEWLSRPSNKRNKHPAHEDWKFCVENIESAGHVQGREEKDAQAFALKWSRTVRNNWSLVRATHGSVEHFKLGHLANYGDEAVMRRVQSVKWDHSQYLDLLAEFFCVAWFLSEGNGVTVSENPGWADFRITVPGWLLPVVTDCKRMAKGTSENSLKTRIEKANKQIKAVGVDAYGIIIVDATALLPNVCQLSDAIPPEILQVEGWTRKLLSRYFTAISAALLVWNEVSLLGPEPSGEGITLIARTKSMVIEHQAPVHVLPRDISPISIGQTNTSFIRRLGRQ